MHEDTSGEVSRDPGAGAHSSSIKDTSDYCKERVQWQLAVIASVSSRLRALC